MVIATAVNNILACFKTSLFSVRKKSKYVWSMWVTPDSPKVGANGAW